MRWWTVVAVVLAGLLTSTSRADDPPAKDPPRHENKVTPEAQAAIAAHKRLVYRLREHGVESVTGSLVVLGLDAPGRAQFEYRTPDRPSVWPSADIKPRLDAAGVSGHYLQWILGAGFFGVDALDFDEYDATVFRRNERLVVSVTEYWKGEYRSNDFFEMDAGGLLRSHTHKARREGTDPVRDDYVATYTWDELGEARCIRKIDLAYGDVKPGWRYAIELRYANSQGLHLLTGFDVAAVSPEGTPKSFMVHLDDVRVNDKRHDLPHPWKHVSKVTPEAQAAIERYAALVDRPADHGLKSLKASVLVDDAALWTLAFDPPSQAELRPAEGRTPTKAQSGMAEMLIGLPLRIGLSGFPLVDSDEYDAEMIAKGGDRVLAVTEFHDGAPGRRAEFGIDAKGLVTSLAMDESATGGPKMSLALRWEPSGTRSRPSGLDVRAATGGVTMRFEHTLTYTEAAGITVVVSIASSFVVEQGAQRVERSTKFRLTDLVVNGAKADASGLSVHRNEISPEAKAALERLARSIDRPREHGLVTATGNLEPLGLAFDVSPQAILVRPASPDADTRAPGFARFSELLLLIALEGPPVAGGAEYDAAFVDRLGTPVLTVTVFKDGKPLEQREAVLDENGLVTSLRFVGLQGSRTINESRFGWARVGDRWQVARVESWNATTALHLTVVYAYSDVAGMRLPLSMKYVASNLGAEFDGKAIDFTVANLVVNGKKVETPSSPFHVNDVTADAAKLLAAYGPRVCRPADHGLRSASGAVTTGEPQSPIRCRFSFSAPRFLSVTVLPPSKADTPEGRAADIRARFPMLLAFDGVHLVESLEFDAHVLARDGTSVLEVVEYAKGQRTSTSQFTFGPDGLIATSRRTDGPAESGGPTDTCMRLRWEKSGDQSRIVACDLSTGSLDAPERTSFVLTYATVAGVDVPASWTVTARMGGPPVEETRRIEDLVVNGKRASVSPGAK